MTDRHDFARRWVALWNGDMALLHDLVAEAIVTRAVMVGQTVEAPMVGRDALGGWIAHMRAAMPTLHFRIEVGTLLDGDMIALRWRVTGSHDAARISFAGTDILRTEGGQIAEYWVSSDTSLMMGQMQAGAGMT